MKIDAKNCEDLETIQIDDKYRENFVEIHIHESKEDIIINGEIINKNDLIKDRFRKATQETSRRLSELNATTKRRKLTNIPPYVAMNVSKYLGGYNTSKSRKQRKQRKQRKTKKSNKP
jgi:hypothetical protein